MKWAKTPLTPWHAVDEVGRPLCRNRSGSGRGAPKGRWTWATDEWPDEMDACYVCRALLGPGPHPWKERHSRLPDSSGVVQLLKCERVA